MHGSFQGQRVRIIGGRNAWSLFELEILEQHWPDLRLLKKRLPMRTEQAIKAMASRCGLKRTQPNHVWTAREHSDLKRMVASGHTRRQIAVHLGLTLGQVANRLQYEGMKQPRRRPVLCGNPLADAIRQRAFDLNLTMTDLDRSLGYRGRFSGCFRGKRFSDSSVGRAVRALGGKLHIEWED